MNASAPASIERRPFFGLDPTFRRNLTTWFAGLSLTGLAAFGLQAGLGRLADARAPRPEPSQPLAVRAVVVREETVQSATRSAGTVRELRRVALSFRVGGTVQELQHVPAAGARAGEPPQLRPVDLGDELSEGTLLARLDPSDYRRARDTAAERLATARARLEAAGSDAERARLEFARAERLGQRETVSRQELDTTRTRASGAEAMRSAAAREVESARIALDQAEADLAYCTLSVPLPRGTVTERLIEVGERVTAGQKAFELVDLSAVEVSCSVPDRLVGGLAPGQRVPVSCDAQPEATFEGVVSRIAAVADPQTRTYRVEVRIDAPQGLRPGMVATVAFGRAESAWLVPMTAVARGDRPGSHIVYRLERDGDHEVVRPQPVSLDGFLDDRLAIRPAEPQSAGALRPGDRLVATGLARLHDGQPVRTTE